MIIYKITNNINNKIYIGQTTTSIKERFRGHCKKIGDSAICRAILKYGKDNFKIEEIYKTDTIEDLNEKEIFYIMELNTICPNGYNIRSGGDNKIVHEGTKLLISINTKKAMENPEIRKKMSEARIGVKPWNKGIKTGIQVRNQKIMCNETKEVFKNQLDASIWLNCSKSAINRHINKPNKLKTVKGFTFKRI